MPTTPGARAVAVTCWIAGSLSVCCGGCATGPAPAAALVAPTDDLRATSVFPGVAQRKWYEAVEPDGEFILRDLTPVAAGSITLEPPGDATRGGLSPPIVSGLHVRSRTFRGGADPASADPIEDRFLVLAMLADGSVVLVSSREGGRTTTFDPPITYMPGSLRPGERFESESRAVVRDGRGREESSGRARRTVEYAGDQATPSAPDGSAPRPAVRVVLAALDLDLFPARVVTQTQFLIDDTGIVGEEQTTRVRILGVPAETRRHNVILRRAAPTGDVP